MTKSLIIGINSGIGTALAEELNSQGHDIHGTTRAIKSNIQREENNQLYYCDLKNISSIDRFVAAFSSKNSWDNLIFCPAQMEPIGDFETTKIDDWLETFNVNFNSQVYLLHKLLKCKRNKLSRVIFFAGGGVNGVTPNYSCYTTSKIAMVKLVELLDYELKNVIFTILGPGWVKTKIHDQSIDPKHKDLPSYRETQKRIKENNFIEMQKVISSIQWILEQPKEIVGGRNFSTAHDRWEDPKLVEMLRSDKQAYKLRRHRNFDFADNV